MPIKIRCSAAPAVEHETLYVALRSEGLVVETAVGGHVAVLGWISADGRLRLRAFEPTDPSLQQLRRAGLRFEDVRADGRHHLWWVAERSLEGEDEDTRVRLAAARPA